MDSLFPTGFPLPTGFYLTFYVLTLVIHVVFMNYVFAGSAYLAAETLFRRRGPEPAPPAEVLRDWIPLMLSAAITAGVAPLLFLQILYKMRFFTSNLLLSHRWMGILPVLIVAFYLCYLAKTALFDRVGRPRRAAVAVVAFLCFGFVALSWTENHLLSLQSQDVWSSFFASGTIVYHTKDMAPRLALWLVGAFPTMATVLGWQLWYARRHGRFTLSGGTKRTALLALGGLIASAACAVVYYYSLAPEIRDVLTGPLARPFGIAAAVGLGIQFVAWAVLFRRGRFTAGLLSAASAGLATSLVGATVVREARRLAAIDVEALFSEHAAAMEVAGLPLFLTFFVLNAILVAACFVIVRRGFQPARR